MTTAPEIASVATAADAPEIEIRPVETRKEYEACLDLQRDTWGRDFSETVPVSMMMIAVRMGGLCTGAFGPDGELLGFVFGVTGPREGEIAHWSHMLAVRKEARNAGIGKRLKFAQRELAVAKGVDAVYWTFDPLVGRNAHFNLNQLGASIAEYVPDMYGASNSVLHRLGTDRFIARWDMKEDVEAVLRGRAKVMAMELGEMAAPGSPGMSACGGVEPAATVGGCGGSGSRPMMGVPGERVSLPVDADPVEVVVPREIRAVEAECFDEALRWRAANRRAFVGLLGEGYSVGGFIPGREYGRYVVTRGRGESSGRV